MTQLPIDFQTGWELAVEGMDRAYSVTREQWRDAAFQAVFRTASELRYFTADDVWARFKEGLSNSSALGHVMRAAKKNGWIEGTGEFQHSARAPMHCKPIPVWKSLVYGRAN